MTQTQKMVDIQNYRDDLEEQLHIRESQIEEIISQSQSEANHTSGSTNRSDNLEGNLKAIKSHFKNAIFMLANFFEFEAPPLERPNDKKWDSFLMNLKRVLREEQSEKEELKDHLQSYKQMLDLKSLEAEENEKTLKSKIFSLIKN